MELKMGKFKHGYARKRPQKRPEYDIWTSIIQRCTNPKNRNYSRYGGRGIGIDPSFLDFATFINKVGDRPSKFHSIERINNNRGYEPGNVVWATKAEQSRNTRQNLFLSAYGETLIQNEWARRLKCHHTCIEEYLARGRKMEWIVDHFTMKSKAREIVQRRIMDKLPEVKR
jgi:hypothetical protein